MWASKRRELGREKLNIVELILRFNFESESDIRWISKDLLRLNKVFIYPLVLGDRPELEEYGARKMADNLDRIQPLLYIASDQVTVRESFPAGEAGQID
jgi:hypothetical protein